MLRSIVKLLCKALVLAQVWGWSAPCHAASDSAKPPQALQVLHWWTSASERRAASVLAERLAGQNLLWVDAAIPGGAGQGAGKVLRSRVLAGDAPEVTQIIGASIGEWAQLGLLLELDGVARTGRWHAALFPTIDQLIQYRQHVVAVPLGIHRINTLLLNRKVLARLNVAVPRTWAEFEAVAAKVKAAGLVPLAQSRESWQVATLFENLVLAEGGPAYYRELFVRQSEPALDDARLVAALERLRRLKAWMPQPLLEQSWVATVAQLERGQAAMMVMGDWAKAEMQHDGKQLDVDFACTTVPGTERYHLYSVDTLTMMVAQFHHVPAQERMAALLLQPSVQLAYNNAKGSVPVRRDVNPRTLDSCAQASWQAFAQGAALQAPSLTHRMAADESARDAIMGEIQRYFVDDTTTVAEVQKRLAAVFRTLNQRSER